MKVSTAQQMATVAAAKKNHLAIQAEFSVAAAMDSAGQPTAPTFSLVGYTGAAIKQFWSRNPLVVDLAGMDTGSGVLPILYGHDASLDSVLGQSSTTINDGRQLVLSGDLFGASQTSDQVLMLAKRGMKFQASIGADINRIENISAGEKVMVNGREFAGPISVVRNSKLREVSIVLMGADPATSAAIAAEASEDSSMADNATNEPADKVEAAASVATEPTPAVVAAATDGTAEKISGLETKLNAALEKLEAIAKVEAARSARPAGPAIHTVEASVDNPEVVLAALCSQAGLPRMEAAFDAKTLEASDKIRREVGLQTIILAAANANGYTGSQRLNSGNLPAVIQASFASHQLADMLSNLANKFLLNGFNAVERTWERMSAIRSVNDFKVMNLLRLNGDLKFQKLGNAGELKVAKVSDYKRTLAADTYGISTQITRQDMYNDDLSALSLIPQRMGRGAALAMNEAIWAEFLTNNSSYYQTITPAAGNALSYTSLSSATVAYNKLNDPDGNPLSIPARLLLVPPTLYLTSKQLMTSNLLLASSLGSTSSKSFDPASNVLMGEYEVVKSNYLETVKDSSGNSLGSSSTWWLAADGADLPAIDIAFLNGQQQPIIEQVLPDSDKLGIVLRGYFDFGVTKGEPLAVLRVATS